MAKLRFLERHGIVRNAIREDLLFFALLAIIVFFIGLIVCNQAGWAGFFQTLWDLIKNPQKISMLSLQNIIGLVTITLGFVILFASVLTLRMNYSSTLIIRRDHKLITHGIYRFTRHPIYFGVIMVTIGVTIYTSSLLGFLIMSVLIPIFLIRIRIEERLLIEEFGNAYLTYMETTCKLIPFIY